MSAFDFEFTSIDGRPLPMARFEGSAVLMVNTASFCGFTPQYEGLQTLWETYRDRGLVVLGVPSNDFGNQEPEDEAKVKEFCEVNFGVNFPLTAKQTVVGEGAHPLFRWIAGELGEAGAPQWNFHKYLLAPDGSLAGVWPSRVEPLAPDIVDAVENVLPR